MDDRLKGPKGEGRNGAYSMNRKKKPAEGSKQMKNRRCRSKILISHIIMLAMMLSLCGLGLVPVYGEMGSSYDMVWFTSFGDSNHYDEGFSVIAVEDGFVYTGTASDSEGLEYTFLVKTDEQGDTCWEKKFGGTFRSSGRSVSQTADGGYIIAGTSKMFFESFEKVYLIKTDKEGNLQWEQKLDLSAQGYAYNKRQGFSVKETIDGGYIIAGMIIRGDTSDALIIKNQLFGPCILGAALWG